MRRTVRPSILAEQRRIKKKEKNPPVNEKKEGPGRLKSQKKLRALVEVEEGRGFKSWAHRRKWSLEVKSRMGRLSVPGGIG